MSVARGSLTDPFICANWGDTSDPYFKDHIQFWINEPRGYAARPPRVASGERTAVVIVAGQSNSVAHGVGGAFSPVNAGKVDSLSIFNGGVYEGKDPGPNVDGPAISWLYRFADKLISAGKYDRVIMVPIGMGSASVANFAPGGVLGNFIPVAVRRCMSLSLPITAILWQQGERENMDGVSQAIYQSTLQAVIDASRTAGVTAPWLVGKSTMLSGITSSPIRAALAAVVNNIDVFAGADTDTLGGTTYREPGLTHFNPNGCDAAAALWYAALNAVV